MTNNILQFVPRKIQKLLTSDEIKENVRKAEKARDDYINSLEGKRLDDAINLQIKINKALDKSGNCNNRLSTISGMMMESFLKLNETLQSFKK